MASATHSAACGSALCGQSGDCAWELTLAEKLAVHHYRGHAALQRAAARGNAPGEEAGAQRAETGKSKNRASFACLSAALQELDLLEASVSRVRPQRAARGAKKLQSSFGPPDPAQGNDCGCGNHRTCDADAAANAPGHAEGTTARAPTTSTIMTRRCSLPKLSLDVHNMTPDLAAKDQGSPQSRDLHNVTLAMLED